MMMSICIDASIVPKPRMTRADRWKKRPCVLRYWDFADVLRAAAAAQNFELGDRIKIEFHIAMPKSWSKKKRSEMEGRPHKNKPDLDNCIKSCADILKKEDKTIYEITATKSWSREPRIIIWNQWQ